MPFDLSELHSPGESLSVSSSDDESATSFVEQSDSDRHCGAALSAGIEQNNSIEILWSKCILHLDVDCFYCQCEEIDGPPDYKERPIAIGQKHIIVTSNYVAREVGVKKLQSRSEAKQICPNLLIIEGSDLERYRAHSRNIYNTFRKAVRRLGEGIPARKGGFDEMCADITAAVKLAVRKEGSRRSVSSPNLYVYGEMSHNVVCLTEDQSGATCTVGPGTFRDELSPLYSRHIGFSELQKTQCSQRLQVAAGMADEVRRAIKSETGFNTTVGVSVSPMLAKLASELKKPNSLNILYPWKASQLILPMPLRKIPQLGHRTLSVLTPCLRQYHSSEPDFWTCRDLLQVPRHQVQSSIENLKSCNSSNSFPICDMLFDKCRGVDSSSITDDRGGIPKTVSVENSFRRGTVLSWKAVWNAMEDLLLRLPRLLYQRRSDSTNPDRAFPTTIRVTVRGVDSRIQNRRPFVTKSKQCEINGRYLMKMSDIEMRRQLENAVKPLLDSLLSNWDSVNVTRMNIAATNFSDVQSDDAFKRNPERCIFSQLQSVSSKATASNEAPHFDRTASSKRSGQDPCSLRNNEERRCIQNLKSFSHKPPQEETFSWSDIDVDVLAELPPHIAQEVRLQYGIKSKGKTQKSIDSFFSSKNGQGLL